MACFYPLKAFQNVSGAIQFHDHGDCRPISLPCGQCIGCRIARSKTWAMRCVHEASLHPDNCFITLTYAPEYLPFDTSLRHRDYQLFMKRLRERLKPRKIKFYQCGEYGDQNGRPHYHAIIFNYNFPDWDYLFDTDSGEPVFTSASLESIWGLGFVTIGTVTFASAAYIARYCMKKINGKLADVINEKTGLKVYERFHSQTGEIVTVMPEYQTMSRRPAIGVDWIAAYTTDVYPKDFTTINGSRMCPPRAYDRYLKKVDPAMYEDIKQRRIMTAVTLADDNTEQRLLAKEAVKVAQNSQLKRSL